MDKESVSWTSITCDLTSLMGECNFHALQFAGERGLAVPAVVIGLVIVVLVFFAFATARLLVEQKRFNQRFEGLIDLLKSERTSPVSLDRAKLNRVGEKLGADELCEHGWREFKETIVSEGTGDSEKIYNTRQAHEFFPEEDIIESSIPSAFFRSVPGVLTSLGLLGTFLAILLGLAVIQVPETADGSTARIEGIESFVNALSGKFVSSVFALALAIVFTLLETRVFRKVHETYRNFCQSFDAVFPRRTAEEVLMAMNLEIQEQRKAFEHFNTDLSTRFKDGVTEGLGPVLERIVSGLDSLTGDRDSNIEALLERLTREFRESMTQSAGVEFGQIATAMGDASELINRANEQTAAGRQSFEALMAAMEESRQKQSQVAEQQGATLNSILEKMVSTVSQTSEASRSAVDSTVQSLVNRMDETREKQAGDSERQDQALTALLERMVSTVNDMSEVTRASIETTVGDLAERIRRESEDNAAALRSTLDQYSEGMKVQISALCERVERAASGIEDASVSGSQGLNESIRAATERLEQSTQSVLDQTEATSGQLAGELSRVLSENRDSGVSLRQAQEALEKTLVTWNQGTQQMRTVVAPLSNAAQQLETTTNHLTAMMTDVQQIQGAARQLVEGARSELDRIAQMESSSERILQEHRRVFEVVREGLGSTIDTLTAKLETIQTVTSRGLQGQLEEFDNHLGVATGRLGAAVDELRDALEDATQTLSSPGQK
ncbi:anti-phage ZorAB system protein ZorA [Myxococcota bacterium]|nr:anti-phage ZorAB system protein ZorA [Myxococcota bacterium]